MSADRQRRWRRLRRILRWCRITVLLLIIALLLAVIYLGRVGLPEFLKTPLQTELRRRGLNLQCERVRLNWFRGVVADAVTVGPAFQPEGPQLHLDELAIKLNWHALLRQELQVDAVGIRQGRLVFKLSETNQPPAPPFSLDDIAALIRFQPNGEWKLEAFQARCLGLTLRLSGALTNAVALRHWASATRPPATANARALAPWRAALRQVVEIRRRMRFTNAPDLLVAFHGDARDPARFAADVRFKAAGAQTDWGTLDNLRLTVRLNEPPSNGWFNTTLQLDVDNARTRWGELREGRLTARFANPPTNAVPARVDLELSARQASARPASLQSARLIAHSRRLDDSALRWDTQLSLSASGLRTDWGQSGSNQLAGRFVHCLTHAVPESATASLHLDGVRSRWGEARRVAVAGDFALTNPPPTLNAAWGWWTHLTPYALRWDTRIEGLHTSQLAVHSFAAAGRWAAPVLQVTDLNAHVFGGDVRVPAARLDVASRELRLTGLNAGLDWHLLAPLIGGVATNWLGELAWSQPPTLTGEARLVLPAWTNAAPDWRGTVLPSLVARGGVRAGELSWRGFAVQSLAADFAVSNLIWQLPALAVERPEGGVRLSVEQDPETREARATLRSRVDPASLQPLLGAGAAAAFKLLQFTGPPQIAAELRGRLTDPESLGVQAQVGITNFVFRNEHFDNFHAGVLFTNWFLLATNVAVTHAAEWANAEAVGFNLDNAWVYLTNAASRMDPMRVARVIGTNVIKAIAPFTFSQPPTARVNGHVPARGKTDSADLTFELAGGPFHYWRFNLPAVAGTVHWQGDSATITNLTGDFYQGRMGLNMRLDFQPGGDADFSFQSAVTNVDLHALVTDVAMPTNQLQGIVTGVLNVTHANTSDWKSWDGHGNLAMRNGFLWDFPLFAIFSKMLNALAPGSGNARATAAKATFTINRSVIRTDDMLVKATPLQLRFSGTVDFDGNINARVESEILRDAPLLGPLLNLAISPITTVLTYKITGTLGSPRSEPLYIPRLFRSLLDPAGLFKTPAPAGEPSTSSKPPAK
jgi:hypothetical protein